MKCLVVGGAGFIGRGVVRCLLDGGHTVGALDDLSNGRRENLSEFSANASWLGLQEGSTSDVVRLRSVLAETWDAVVHLGLSSSVQKSIDDPSRTFRNDLEGTLHLLEACRQERATPRVVLTSSSLVYDTAGPTALGEDHPSKPAAPYAATRVAIEALGSAYHASYGLRVSTVRPFNVYGPFQRSTAEGGVVAAFLKRDIDQIPIQVKGSGEQTRDLLYVDDCADLICRMAVSDAAIGHIFNAGTGNDVSIRELATRCASAGTEVRFVPHDHPQAEVARSRADISKAARLLDWAPRIPLEEGLRLTRSWYLANPLV